MYRAYIPEETITFDIKDVFKQINQQIGAWIILHSGIFESVRNGIFMEITEKQNNSEYISQHMKRLIINEANFNLNS